MTHVPGARFEREIHEQPEALAAALAHIVAAADAVADDLRKHPPAFAYLVARGSSDNAARYAQYIFGVRNGIAAALGTPSLVTAYQREPDLRRALVVGISQSGQSPDVVSLVATGARQGAVTVAVTNAPDSPLARAARHVVPLAVGREEAVAASKTYSASLLALASLSAAWRGDEAARAALARVPEAVAAALGREVRAQAAALAHELVATQAPIVAGRGLDHGTAHEIALKLKETSALRAEAFSTADFLHGPIAMLEPGARALFVVTGAVLEADAAAALPRLEARGARCSVITDRPRLAEAASTAVLLDHGLPDWLAPIAAVVPGQLAALESARLRGLDPDAPPGLAKVTRTF